MDKFLKFFENVQFSCIMCESFIIVVTLFVSSLCIFFEGSRGWQGGWRGGDRVEWKGGGKVRLKGGEECMQHFYKNHICQHKF